MNFSKTTENPSHYDFIEDMSTDEILTSINKEDAKVAEAVKGVVPKIAELVDIIYDRYLNGGRVFYIGAGTSGRLGILDASEIAPTYGIKDRIIGLIAGGDRAIRHSVEAAEDNTEFVKADLNQFDFCQDDVLIGIAASGTTPYVLEGLKYAKSLGAVTGCITNNLGSPIADQAEYPIEIVVGPEFITGSTRMKSGTSQKMVLNMISTALMVKVGRVKGNKMVNMQLNNNKLVNRGIGYIMEELNISSVEASSLLEEHNSVQKAIDSWLSKEDKSKK